eukprot:363913-Chlamydomonas_euryale.AAC.11
MQQLLTARGCLVWRSFSSGSHKSFTCTAPPHSRLSHVSSNDAGFKTKYPPYPFWPNSEASE